MKAEYERKALYLILDNLNKGEKTVTTEEIGSIVDDDDDDMDLVIGSIVDDDKRSKVLGILKCLAKKKIIRKSGEGVYSVMVDIAALREIILNLGKSGEEERKKAEASLCNLLTSEWFIVAQPQEKADGNSDDDKSDDSDDEIAKRRAYLEERRRELIKKIREENNDEYEDDDNEEEESVDEDCEYEDDDDSISDPRILAAIEALGEGFSVTQAEEPYIYLTDDGTKTEEHYFLTANGLKFDDGYFSFTLINMDGELFLSDGGNTLLTVNNRISLEDEQIRKMVDNATDFYDEVFEKNHCLVSYVSDCDKIVPDLMRLYVVMEVIYHTAMNIAEERETNEISTDPLTIKVLAKVVKSRNASTSYIQRNFRIGYDRAGTILEWMERMGYVAPSNGGKERGKVLLSEEEFIKIYGPVDQ